MVKMATPRRFATELSEPARMFLALTAIALATPAVFAETAPIESAAAPVATIVMVKTPPGVTLQQLEAGFRQAVPLYENIAGLIRKYVIADGRYR
jgi:hypothetical protein